MLRSIACVTGGEGQRIFLPGLDIYRAVGRSFRFGGRGGGAEIEGRRPEEIFKFRVSEMPFSGPRGRFDRILMVRKQRFSMSKFTI